MLGGELVDDRASTRFVRELAQCLGHSGNEARIGVAQDEAQLGRGPELGVGDARVVERPLHQFFDEVVAERGERRAFGPRQHHHHRRAVLQTIVEQVAGQRVVFGVRAELAHVFGRAERAHAGAGAFF